MHEVLELFSSKAMYVSKTSEISRGRHLLGKNLRPCISIRWNEEDGNAAGAKPRKRMVDIPEAIESIPTDVSRFIEDDLFWGQNSNHSAQSSGIGLLILVARLEDLKIRKGKIQLLHSKPTNISSVRDTLEAEIFSRKNPDHSGNPGRVCGTFWRRPNEARTTIIQR